MSQSFWPVANGVAPKCLATRENRSLVRCLLKSVAHSEARLWSETSVRSLRLLAMKKGVFVRRVCAAFGMSHDGNPAGVEDLYKNDESVVVRHGNPNLSW